MRRHTSYLSMSQRVPAARATRRPARALRFFDDPPLSEARQQAALLLTGAPSCSCCNSIREHVFNRIGWTFYQDDDPEQLAQAFDAAERAIVTRILAACILLFGRERVTVHPCS